MAPNQRSFYRTTEFKVIAFAIVSTAICTYGTMELLIMPDPQDAADVERPCRSSLPANYTVPAAVLNANGFVELNRWGVLKRRRCRLTVINLLLFHNEVDLLEVRLRELGNAVDHFVVLESTRNFRMHKRNLLLKPLLNTPRFQPFQDRLVYGYNADYPEFPEDADPRAVRMALHRIFMDELMVTFTKSFPHVADDAWILFTSADEIPSASVVDFLSHHDGLPDVVAFGYAKSVYSFLMPHTQGLSTERAACTWRCLRDDLATSLDALRFATMQAVADSPWTVGTREHPAGWHCSWCLGPAGVVAKIASEPEAINRSVDAELTTRLMRTGRLYSGKLVASSEPEKSRFVLPAFVEKNPMNFKSILLSMSRDQA